MLSAGKIALGKTNYDYHAPSGVNIIYLLNNMDLVSKVTITYYSFLLDCMDMRAVDYLMQAQAISYP